MSAAARPLRGVDFSTHLSGPLASQLLIQLGADVVKIENPRVGDGNRALPPLITGSGLFHVALNSGARSLAADTGSPHWPRVVEAAARWADAVIVGARPADARRRGIDFDSLARTNPRLVYCAITGYGEVGPWAEYPAHGLNSDAFAGLVEVDSSGPSPRPSPIYESVDAPLAGVFAALGIVEGVRRRDLGASAQYVHVSMWATAMWFNWRHPTALANLGEPWHAYGDLGPRYAMYRTADERVVLVCPIERKFWQRFVDLLGLPSDWKQRGSWEANGMDFGARHDDENEAIGRAIADRSLADWITALQAADIPFAPVLTIAEALAAEHARANRVMRAATTAGHEVLIPDLPVHFGAFFAQETRPTR